MSAKKNQDKLFDLRTLEHLFSNGTLKPSEYDKYLKSLPDEEGNYDFINTEEETEAQLDPENEEEEEIEEEEDATEAAE